jgi:hypothetical protein
MYLAGSCCSFSKGYLVSLLGLQLLAYRGICANQLPSLNVLLITDTGT